MKALVLSGGGSRGAFTAGVVKHLLRDGKMNFDMAVGCSTGSLVGGPALLGDYNHLTASYTRMSDTDIFRNSFIGHVANFLNLHDGPIQASMEPLHDILKEYYFTMKKLKALLDTGKYFAVTIVNVYTGNVHFVSTKHLADKKIKPTTFVKAVLASCCEPVFTKPIRVFEEEDSRYKNDLFYDGGVKEFIPFEHAIVQGATDIWAISTNTLTNANTDWGRTSPDKVNTLKALLWTIGATLDEVARGDRFRADNYRNVDRAKQEITKSARGFGLSDEQINHPLDSMKMITPEGRSLPDLRVIRPSKPLRGGLIFDPAVMLQYLTDGELAAEKFINDGAPLYSDHTLAPWIFDVDYV
jgi:NTE family protein